MGLLIKILCFLFTIFNVLFTTAFGEILCPPAEDIAPCVCTHRPTTILRCIKVLNGNEITYAFQNSKRYTYQEVHIQNSVITFIPSNIFENTTIKELYIENSTLSDLFDKPPKSNGLNKFHIENTKVFRFSLLQLSNFTNLQTAYIDSVKISNFTSKYTSFFPKSLKQITLRRTGTKEIREGALDSLVNLDKLTIDSNPLTNISRAAFPNPFKVRFMYLNNNTLNSLPDGLFSNMPRLQFLSLKDNQLTEVPKAAFGSRYESIPYLNLEGNPLSCDCILVWLIKDKPEILSGTCETPRRLKGRTLSALRPGDFNCAK